MKELNILIVYTGGTIGMQLSTENDSLIPAEGFQLKKHFPEIFSQDLNFEWVSMDLLKDSSDMNSSDWLKIVEVLAEQRSKFDAFIVLHGTDTMSYTAAALSYLCADWEKPIVITGSQIPAGEVDSDAPGNLQGSVTVLKEICSSTDIEKGVVAVYFNDVLYQGNRIVKISTSEKAAFYSPNYPELGSPLKNPILNKSMFQKRQSMKLGTGFSSDVTLLKVHPGLSTERFCKYLESANLEGLLIESYGAGNIPSDPALLSCIKNQIAKGLLVMNVSQCHSGSVDMNKYLTGQNLKKLGVVAGKDMTTEAALVKLMLACNFSNREKALEYLSTSIAGEIST